MHNLPAFIGRPRVFKGNLKIYPPTIAEVVDAIDFPKYRSLFTTTSDDIKDQLRKIKPDQEAFPTPFEFLLINAFHDQSFRKTVEDAFQFFTHQPITFLFEQKKILIGELHQSLVEASSLEDLVFIDDANFFDFQNAIRESLGEKPQKPPEPENPNEHPEIKRMKVLARERDRIKAKNASKNGISLETSLTAICCMGIGITPLNVGEMSYAAIGPIMNMMQEKEKYDIDIRSLLAGADSKKVKPKYWIRNNEKD